jgi:DNA-binding transcriptional ArsR family regulator
MAAKSAKKKRTPKLLDWDTLHRAAECLRVISHPVRLRMVQLLLQAEYKVADLADACEVPSHVASEHLRLMEHCGFLERKREGRCSYYRVTEPHLEELLGCIGRRFGK